MNVSFLENNPINSVIVDSSDGRPLYEVQTPWKLSNRITTMRRLKSGVAPGAGEIIAEIHWRTLGSSTIMLYGSTMRIKDWLKKDGMLSSCVTYCELGFQLIHPLSRSRILTASGNSYKWSHGSGKFTVIPNNSFLLHSIPDSLPPSLRIPIPKKKLPSLTEAKRAGCGVHQGR